MTSDVEVTCEGVCVGEDVDQLNRILDSFPCYTWYSMGMGPANLCTPGVPGSRLAEVVSMRAEVPTSLLALRLCPPF